MIFITIYISLYIFIPMRNLYKPFLPLYIYIHTYLAQRDLAKPWPSYCDRSKALQTVSLERSEENLRSALERWPRCLSKRIYRICCKIKVFIGFYRYYSYNISILIFSSRVFGFFSDLFRVFGLFTAFFTCFIYSSILFY